MAIYYVDDGGDNTTGESWATAYTSVSALDDAVALASGDIIYIGHDHVCQYAHSATRTITGPSSGAPCVLISVTQGSVPPVCQKSTSPQIDTSEGGYQLIFAGGFAHYGTSYKCGSNFVHNNVEASICLLDDVTIAPGNAGRLILKSRTKARNITIDLSADTASTALGVFVTQVNAQTLDICGLTVLNGGFRTAYFSYGDYSDQGFALSDADLSSLAAGINLFGNAQAGGRVEMTNCKLPNTWSVINGFPVISGSGVIKKDVYITNCGSAHDPSFFAHFDVVHILVSSKAIYRSGGAEIELTPISWFCQTPSLCDTHRFANLPWLYSETTAGEKTFEVYITNDLADLTNAEIWLEVEALSELGTPLTAMTTNKRATILTTGAAHTDDTTSTWNGTGPAFTYKQKLSVTATVAIAGLFRARICVARELPSSAYFYIDPKVVVS